LSLKAMPSLFLILLGSLDCLTTVIGTMYFGTRELNPLIAGLVYSDIPAFVALKLSITIGVGLIFILAQKILMQTKDKENRSFKIAFKTLRIAYFGIALFLAIVVINNILTLLQIVP
jgi:hypothetical protein